jgi:hypothetical protein
VNVPQSTVWSIDMSHAMRHASAVGISALVVVSASVASAQTLDRAPVLAGYDAAARGGRVHGVVRDDAGRAVVGASVIAMGSMMLPIAVRSDVTGQFAMDLRPGEYILRATRAGYASSYREPLRISSSTQLERNITLTRQDLDTTVNRSATAWRLRHITPTALREMGHATLPAVNAPAGFESQMSLVDRMLAVDFTGQVNFLTTSSLAASQNGWLPAALPRGIAYIAVGAPVGRTGDWSVRGAMSGGALSSWVMLGEYTGRRDQAHGLRVGVSYSSQPTFTAGEPLLAPATDRARSVGGVYGFDRWQMHPAIEIDYGLRFDRYDYVPDGQFVSPRLGLRVRALPGTHVTLRAAQASVAPGANEFLPPTAGGVWLPPERTFTPLLPGAAFRSERIRDLDVGVEQRLARGPDAPAVALRRFRQSAHDQVATLFGQDAESNVGHFYVATPGSVTATGWAVRMSGPLTTHVSGAVSYTTSVAEWTSGADAGAIALIAPHVVRPARERFQDVKASMNASIPETSTRVEVAYRVSAARADLAPAHALAVGRFDVEVRQALPLQPTRDGKTELVVLFRNLSRDVDDPGSLYDEMLTVAPPLRIMGGVQVKF